MRYQYLLCLLLSTGALAYEDCLRKDSISCLQKTFFSKAKEFFDRDSLEIAPGVSLVRGARSGRNLAGDVADRQADIENFIGDEVESFVRERSLKVSVGFNFYSKLDLFDWFIGSKIFKITFGLFLKYLTSVAGLQKMQKKKVKFFEKFINFN